MTDITTDYGKTIDNVITNVTNLSALVYESLISDHRPILLADIDTCMQMENYTEVDDDDNINKNNGNNEIELIND